MITLIANSKGGVGKTALATSIVAEISKRDYAVIGVDLDSVNKSASNEWSVDRKEEQGKFYYLSGDIQKELLDAKADYDEVVIDAGGYDNEEFRRAVALADVVLIPVLVGSASNIIGMQTVAQIIEKIRPNNPPRVVAVPTRAPNRGNPPELKRAWEEIDNDPLAERAPVDISDRSWFVRAFDAGLGVTELQLTSRADIKYSDLAKQEINTLINFIYGEDF